MTRATRLRPVQQIVDAAERKKAERLAASETLLAQNERKLAELEQYRAEYRRAYETRVAHGMSSASIRDYQVFLARLTEAIRQQGQVVTKARLERDLERKQWQEAAVRSKAIDHVMDAWRAEDRSRADKREQRDSDERAQRPRTKLD